MDPEAERWVPQGIVESKRHEARSRIVFLRQSSCRMEIFRANDSFTRSCGLQMAANADGLRFLINGVIGDAVASHVCVTICNFLLVVASVERLFANSPEGKQKTILVFLVRRKVGKVVAITLIATLLRGTILFETSIEYLPYCDELDRSIRHYYNEKRGVRTATKTLVLVVGCYLLSNLVSIIIGFWDHLASSHIKNYYYGYLIASDIASLLTVFGCLMRLPIYCVSDPRIRKAVGRALFRCRVRTIPTKLFPVRQNQLDKWSIVMVSNSLRSNLTGMNNQDWLCGRSKRARDELAFLLQSRRRILVDIAFRIGVNGKMGNSDSSSHEVWLMGIPEEELLSERRNSHYQSLMVNV
ncbi:hypothetical protein RB195_012811 [Necator americanus]|uniref:G-protein coupled receptors family 1 profile domain-containing protein n=1 Tax=Necator americanus TaxID=51031 RepID=A0ABR1DSN7_NECAM